MAHGPQLLTLSRAPHDSLSHLLLLFLRYFRRHTGLDGDNGDPCVVFAEVSVVSIQVFRGVQRYVVVNTAMRI